MGAFAARLKELREARGLSQKQLGEAAGVSHRAVSHWEQGLRAPTWDNVLALGAALGVTCEAFSWPPAAAQPDESPPAPKRGRPKKGPG